MTDQAINAAVDRARACILDTFKQKPSFLATHFSCGTPGMPGYIIKSAAMAVNGQFAEWAKNADGSPDESLHGNVIIRHARQFQRSTTIPALLARLSDSLCRPVILTLKVKVDGKPLLVQKSDKDGCAWFTVELVQDFASALCPRDLPGIYLKKLYDDAKNRRSDSLTEGELRPFDLPRSEAFGMLISRSDEEELKAYVNVLIPQENLQHKAKAWKLLEMLQSALLYFEGARAADSDSGVTGFACAFPLRTQERPTQDRPSKSDTPFGFVLGAPLVTFDTHEVRDCFGRELWNDEVQRYINGEGIEEKLLALIKAVSRVTGRSVEEIQDGWSSHLKTEIAAIVPFSGPQERLRLLGLWMIYLISRLKGAKHEGKAVDFWFVAGERTEFADDKDVRLEKHPLQVRRGENLDPDDEFDCEKFASKTELNERACNLIIRRLEKEHYPWFSQGRYSLFFDISTDGLKPCGLAELRSGSWNRLLAESFKLPDEQELHIPGCLVAFVEGASGEAGLLVCQPEKPGQKARVKRTLRLRDGMWQLASDKRQTQLENYLRGNVPWLAEGEDVKMLGQMATMIADDPHAGGTLVFVENKPASNSFLRLGAPWEWEFNFFHQDRIPLISHDGGTVVWKEQDRIMMAYRQLLTLENNENNGELTVVLAELQRRSLGNEADFPLLGVGTRRWSAALCALRSGVKMVVVISTDGDITCWWGRTAVERELWYYWLPVDFDPSKSEGPKNVLEGLKMAGPSCAGVALAVPPSEGEVSAAGE